MLETILSLIGIILMGIGIGTLGAWVTNRNHRSLPDEHTNTDMAGYMSDELGYKK